MKRLILLGTLLVFAVPAFSCDEECQREKAEINHNVEFPGYLSWKFCEDTAASFIEGDIPSLQSYREDRMDIKYKGNMRNIMNFVQQRKEWLVECDNYMKLTDHGRIFHDKETTQAIFASMDRVIEELNEVLEGTTYVADTSSGGETTIIGNKFDTLFAKVDDHKTVMMRKGQFVRN